MLFMLYYYFAFNLTLLRGRKLNEILLLDFNIYLNFSSTKHSIHSFSVEVNTKIPVGAGLGSSAAYCVCLSTALLVATGKILLPQAAIDVSATCPGGSNASVTDAYQGNVPLSAQDLALICKWSLEAEKLIHGKPSGIDNSVCTYGE